MVADKQDKFLNVPNKRVQSHTCLSPAERKGNVPVLRFPEFSGEWKESTIGKEFDLYSGNTPSRLDKENFVGDVNWITSGELKEHYIGDTKEKISESSAKENNLRLMPEGTFVIAIYGLEAEGVRSTGSIITKQSTISQACMAFTPKGDISNEFLYSWYKNHGNVIGLRYAQGTKQQNLSYDIIEKFKIRYPSLKEQDKLNSFISLLDVRIATQIRIIDKLKSLMRGMNNELMDNPKWAKIYVGDFMEFFSTNSLSWEQLSYDNGQVHNLHYGLIHSGLPTLVDCQKESLPYIQDSSLPKQSTNCKDGDIAFADASEDTTEVGKVVELTNIGDKKIVCGLHTIHGRDVKDITVNGFKGFAFNSKYFHDQLRRIAQGSKVYSINTDNVKSCYLYIPTVAEQQKIVGLLRCMQEKIEVAEYGLQLYKAQKQFLLRGLFV